MALREFIDSEGKAWRAWDVPPWRVYTKVRANRERRVRETPGYVPERRQDGERRRRSASPGMDHGWLCFERDGEKRRLAPPPPDWAQASDPELATLCRCAVPAPPPR